MSVFSSIIASIVFEAFFIRYSKVFDHTTFGELLSKISTNDINYLHNFKKSFFSLTNQSVITKLNIDEKNIIDGITLLLRTYSCCFLPECANITDFLTTNKLFTKFIESNNRLPSQNFLSKIPIFNFLINKLPLKKQNNSIFDSFGISVEYLHSVYNINYFFCAVYHNTDSNCQLILKHIPKCLKLPYEFSTKPISDIRDDFVILFYKNTLRLKRIISYGDFSRKSLKCVILICKYFEILKLINEIDVYSVLKQHIILQISNIMCFNDNFTNLADNINDKFEKRLSFYGFKNVEEVQHFLKNWNFQDDIFRILYLANCRGYQALQVKDIDFILENIQKNFPDLLNIAILNTLSSALKSFNYDMFIERYSSFCPLFISNAPQKTLYYSTKLCCDLIFKALSKSGDPTVIAKDMLEIATNERDVNVKKEAYRSAYVISLNSDDITLQNKISKLANIDCPQAFEEETVTSDYNSGQYTRVRARLSTVKWHPVVIMTNTIFPFFINPPMFGKLLFN
jgi:hypothetical protein